MAPLTLLPPPCPGITFSLLSALLCLSKYTALPQVVSSSLIPDAASRTKEDSSCTLSSKLALNQCNHGDKEVESDMSSPQFSFTHFRSSFSLPIFSPPRSSFTPPADLLLYTTVLTSSWKLSYPFLVLLNNHKMSGRLGEARMVKCQGFKGSCNREFAPSNGKVYCFFCSTRVRRAAKTGAGTGEEQKEEGPLPPPTPHNSNRLLLLHNLFNGVRLSTRQTP